MLWVGLGNPGPDYRLNRHNIGFMAVERIASEYGFSQWRTKGGLCISEGRIGSQKIIALKPQSFMNKSGLPVAEAARYYKISPADITVFHDEIDLGIGRVRVKQGGGHGGHADLVSKNPQQHGQTHRRHDHLLVLRQRAELFQFFRRRDGRLRRVLDLGWHQLEHEQGRDGEADDGGHARGFEPRQPRGRDDDAEARREL